MVKFLNYYTGNKITIQQRFVYLHEKFIVAKQTFLKYITIISTLANKLISKSM